MSYYQNGQPHYGNAPQRPSQQSQQYQQPYNQRPHSYYVGDDQSYGAEDAANNAYQTSPPQSGLERDTSNAQRQNSEIFMSNTSTSMAQPQQAHQVASGYGRQYSSQPPAVPPIPTYNPRQYSAPVQQPNPAAFGGLNRTYTSASSPPQPYNPADYAESILGRNSTVSRPHGFSPTPSYTSSSAHTTPSQPAYPSPPIQQQQYFPPVGTYTQQDNRSSTQPSLSQHQNYQQSPRPSAYTPPAPPPVPVPPSSVSTSEDWNTLPIRQPSGRSTHSYNHSDAAYTSHPLPSPPISNNHGHVRGHGSRHGSQVNIHTQMGYQSNPPLPNPPGPAHENLHRLNSVGRPLPPPPQESDSEESYARPNGGGRRYDQDDLFDEVESTWNIGNAATASPRIVEPVNGDRLHHGQVSRLGSDRVGVTNGHLSPNFHQAETYNYSDESDIEAAAGLAALQAAEAQDQAEEARRRSGGSGLFSNYASLQPPQPHYSGAVADQGSDSDYVGVDMTSFAGTYEPHFSYGGQPEELAAGGTALPSSGNHSQPVSSSGSMRKSEINEGDSYDYGMDNIHPFPAFSPGARVDTFGTGGLAEPTALRRRLSYDEGDEDNFDSVPPLAGEPPDMFYHPGMSTGRPLPPPPTVDTGFQQADWRYHQNQSPGQSYTPDGYQSITPGGTLVPRSTSMLNHSNTPQTQPPTRSKTDAEQTARLRQPTRSSTLYGTESGTPPSEAVPLDLPAIPTGKRFNPAKLTERDFNKCSEPWALSSIISWLKLMAEGETDLKEHLITEGLVALFTNKVPTMNVADAETISARVVQEMYKAGTLVHDEEWLKFSPETMTGVIFQLTGSGCYSPKLHESSMSGRCYAHLCQRTVKKIDLAGQPALEQKDWVTTYNLKKEDIEGVDKHEIERQNILHEVLTGEEKYMADLDVLLVLYRERLLTAQPPVIPPKKLKSFTDKVFGTVDAVKRANEEHLLPQLKYRQKEQGPWIVGFSDIFREWIRKAKQAYLDYCTNFPYAEYLVRQEESRNMIFRAFLDQAQADKRSNKLNWNSYLKAPIARLQRYILLLQTALKHSKVENDEKRNLMVAIDEIVLVTQECNTRVGQVQHKVEISELQSKLILRPGMQAVELNLDHLGRELIHRGDLLRLGGNRFTLLETHALLFDHYLVLGKTVTQRDAEGGLKAEKYDISKLPIPMQLLVLESTDDDPVTRSSVKGITTVSTATPKTNTPTAQLGRTTSNQSPGPGTLTHTDTSSSLNSINTASSGKTVGTTAVLDASRDERIMYPFRIKHLGKEVFTLFAPSIQSRQEWCQKIVEAKTKHASSLFAQNAEPFRLRVMADAAFAYETGSAVQKSMVIKGTPLDRAIDEVERLYQNQGRPSPICRARVNCATAFMQPYGKNMVAVGTDNAVYIAEVDNPRGWTRAIQIPKVTQIAVLEEFSLFLLISDKALIAYHLDAVCPVGGIQPANDSVRRAPQKLSGARDVGFFATGKMKDRTLVFYKKREGLSSTFKVLEPVYQKSTEKKSRLFKTGRTEFFREYDEFYIPTECYGINLFHSSLAVSTSKGFEVLTLDKKQPWSVPDLKAPHVATIASRLQNQTPLGMFRLSDLEFLLVYGDCAVYVNKHGDISRSVIMEFVGHAKAAALYNKYLILFDNDFVEVRNAMNGRLRQVISGRDVRCLDDGLGGGTEGYRSVKVGMAHPERVGVQVVVEMVLNEGAKE